MEKNRIKSILPKPSQSRNDTRSGNRDNHLSEAKKRKLAVGSDNMENTDKKQRAAQSGQEKVIKNSGHRPVTSCTFCRQHKIKCNASENYPNPCQRCAKMNLKCEIDPEFRPKKGSQIQSLKNDVDELKAKIEMLTKNETLLTQALQQHQNIGMNFMKGSREGSNAGVDSYSSPVSALPYNNPVNIDPPETLRSSVGSPLTFLDSRETTADQGIHSLNDAIKPTNVSYFKPVLKAESSDNSPIVPDRPEKSKPEIPFIDQFVLGDVTLTLAKVNELHDRFITKYLPFIPIITSNSATELYHKSQLLFWTVMLISALSEPEPSLYMRLSALIKQLAIETCWIKTPRSTHVVQALILLSIWPLPNEKVLDDTSYRFIGLARNLSLQLGLHRGGEFIQEFSRTQTSLGPNAELWRTRTWLSVFFLEHFWSSVLGLPPQINSTDYLIEAARVDQSLPKDFRCLISLSIFQCKLVNVMGISVTSPDGLLEPSNRAGSLNILDRELERLKFKLKIDNGTTVEVYYMYVKLMICCFAFLPGTPIEDQVKYVSLAYLTATRIVTIVSSLINSSTISLIELPIYIRHAMTYSVLLLFKLHLSRYLLDKYVDSSRQSIVTVHRMLRNTLSSWKDLQNDISRTAKVLENLNMVLYSSPEVFDYDDELYGSIISRMRSHLTASLFYDLVWCIHEARRRKQLKTSEGVDLDKRTPNLKEVAETTTKPVQERFAPLPFYNQITKDDFKTITSITPNGTTVTTLVPTDHALSLAKVNANANGQNSPMEINGIPIAMLEATGSTKDIKEIKRNQKVNTDVASNKLKGKIIRNKSKTDQDISSAENLLSPQIVPLNESVMSAFSEESNSVDLRYNMNESVPQLNVVADQIDNFFQQQSNGWLNNTYQDDDFLGWFDANLISDI